MSLAIQVSRFIADLSRQADASSDQIQIVQDAIFGDINDALNDIVGSYVDEATSYAIGIGAYEFVEDMQLKESIDGVYQIATYSGKTDYSRNRREMLNDLIKNGKVANDGSKYQVIPIKDTTPLQNSMFDMLQAKSNAQAVKREELRNKATSKRLGISAQIQEKMRQDAAAVKQMREAAKNSGTTEFRTASSKQDASTQWVIPEKDMDLTSYLSDLNKNMANACSDTINNIIIDYYEKFLG